MLCTVFASSAFDLRRTFAVVAHRHFVVDTSAAVVTRRTQTLTLYHTHPTRHLTWPVRVIAVVLVDVNLQYWTSKVEHVVSFTAIFGNVCTAHAQKRLLMYFRCKFWHRRSIPRPRFPIRVQNFGDLATFSVDFCILCAECPPYSYFRFVWPTDLESIPHASTYR